ncbi:molecular chaperone HtpG [uncultured Porticoccus sp.]|uniref:molecular chaperone HtpG n=1 Tax=uncultured Porticoccus sp. TaxID=1256050 RepID=UPI0030D8179D
MTVETHGFQTEAKQLLHLMIHSLYSNREIFLRELISNASDAADKLRFEALSDNGLYDGDSDLQIKIDLDPDAGIITLHDNGVGMSKEEVIENLGTIAKSGTAQFLNTLSGDQRKDAQLIGQFGVGFYSAFIVADKVVVETRRAGASDNQAVRWTCEGEAEYSIEDIEKPSRGTSITLHLKDDALEFASQLRVHNIVKKYSDHIGIPVAIRKPDPDAEENTEAPVYKYEVINKATALWTRPRNEITDEEYKEFYKHLTHDFMEPLIWSHNRVEGKLDYTSLLYVPGHAPFDLYNRDVARGLKLYIQRTFIMDDASQFLPSYLRFIRGVLDSNDLPLNVSREILQHSPAVDSIRSALVKRVLDMLDKMAKESPDDYDKMWKEFGTVLKEGPAEDYANRERIAGLLRFATTKTEDEKETASLADYLSRMKEGQEKIYYLVADNMIAARNSAYLEVFRKRNVEVLLLTERLDEWTISHIHEFEGKVLQDIAKGELEDTVLTDDSENEDSDGEKKQASSELIDKIASRLSDKVETVRETRRLTDSPACLVYAEDALSPQMRKLMEAAGQPVPTDKPTLEINVHHPLINQLSKEDDTERCADLVSLLYDQAVLSAGDQLDNPSLFVRRLNQLLFEGAS